MTAHPRRESRDPRKRDGFAGYHQFHNADYCDGDRYGSFEVFWHDAESDDTGPGDDDGDFEPMPSGWVWWPCFPGCLPDGEPNGPFRSSRAAYIDAIKGG